MPQRSSKTLKVRLSWLIAAIFAWDSVAKLIVGSQNSSPTTSSSNIFSCRTDMTVFDPGPALGTPGRLFLQALRLPEAVRGLFQSEWSCKSLWNGQRWAERGEPVWAAKSFIISRRRASSLFSYPLQLRFQRSIQLLRKLIRWTRSSTPTLWNTRRAHRRRIWTTPIGNKTSAFWIIPFIVIGRY